MKAMEQKEMVGVGKPLLLVEENTLQPRKTIAQALPYARGVYRWQGLVSLRGQSTWWHDFYFQPAGEEGLPSHLTLVLPYRLSWFEKACEAFLDHLEASLPQGDTSYSPLLVEEVFLSSTWISPLGVDYSQEAEATGYKPLELLFLLLFDNGCYRAYNHELQLYGTGGGRTPLPRWEGEESLLSPEAVTRLLSRPFLLPRRQAASEEASPFVPRREVPSPLFSFPEEERYLKDLCQKATATIYAPLLALLRPAARRDFETVFPLALEKVTRDTVRGEEKKVLYFLSNLPWHEGLRPSGMTLQEVLSLLPQDDGEVQWVLTSMEEVKGPTPASTFALFTYFIKALEWKDAAARRLPALLLEWFAPEASPSVGVPPRELLGWVEEGHASVIACLPLLEALRPYREEFSFQERMLLTRNTVLIPDVVDELFSPAYLLEAVEVVGDYWDYSHPLGSFVWALCLPLLLETLAPVQAVRLLLEWEADWPPLTLALAEEVQAHPEWGKLPQSWWLPLLLQGAKPGEGK